MTNTDSTSIRDDFEAKAYSGYVGYGISMTDGYYAPEARSAFTAHLRRTVPVDPKHFRFNTEFQPTAEECDAYNATFRLGADWKPDHLEVAVRWNQGWKTYRVTGTRHAYYFIRKLAGREGFQAARVQDWLVDPQGYVKANVISLSLSDITGRDVHGKYRALLDRNNCHYDLARKGA